MSHRDYWTEVVSDAFDTAGISATAGQIASIVDDIMPAHENFGLAFHQPSGPSQLEKDNEDLRRKLKDEQAKIVCRECRGSGYHTITVRGFERPDETECPKCRGRGIVSP